MVKPPGEHARIATLSATQALAAITGGPHMNQNLGALGIPFVNTA